MIAERSPGRRRVPKAIRGNYQGKAYPDAYSTQEKLLIVKYLENARRQYAATIESMGESPTINLFADDRFLDGILDYRGRLCGAGHNFVRIDPDGTIVRCGSKKRYGNILRRTVRLANAPGLCDASYCPYFCEKYTQAEFVRRPLHAAASS